MTKIRAIKSLSSRRRKRRKSSRLRPCSWRRSSFGGAGSPATSRTSSWTRPCEGRSSGFGEVSFLVLFFRRRRKNQQPRPRPERKGSSPSSHSRPFSSLSFSSLSLSRALSPSLSVVLAALDAAKEAGAYKTILDCSEANAGFYERAGLARKEVQMVKYH